MQLMRIYILSTHSVRWHVITFCVSIWRSMDEKDKTIDHNMAGNKIIRFDVGIKRIHSRHEGIKMRL